MGISTDIKFHLKKEEMKVLAEFYEDLIDYFDVRIDSNDIDTILYIIRQMYYKNTKNETYETNWNEEIEIIIEESEE